ncbi:type II CRISPR RNA-guided endonuclease Cas9 [Maribacter hydrothermalis]|uniref:CRISPR-associated endonuclease Cas9 n=1 Tax=Maribacter hydrothermalis TaxID=1836467 RepID=A0A1B7ZF33_9FLAO|nr:type II CRISPR RNA-guided endonuclease Cas9 [Maribacter hydrothermalis]APQ17683.1 CRISPR-associated protein Csn1 [Maribacter hydrothermalis]OBR42158.1 CRISPR-associated protein Csn1 [Maribacter hydrothermalis]
MKKILGLDLGTNSIGWALIENSFTEKEGKINDMGVRIIPMSADILGKFDAGQSHSQTAERTGYRGTRRLYQRDNLRRERLHRVLHILGFLPKHYDEHIDFEKRLGQFKEGKEIKLNYRCNVENKHEFIFISSFNEMLTEFKKAQPELFYLKSNGEETKIPYDWTLYYLRKKALSQPLTKQELAWIILNFNQKRGYYQLRGEEIDDDKNKQFVKLKVKEVINSGEAVKGKPLFDVIFENGWKYDKQVVKTEDWIDRTKEFIVTTKVLKNGDLKRSYKTVDSEKDWAAIKAKTEQDIERSNKTVGEFIYETLLENPTQKIRGKLVKTIERKFYKEELKNILIKQIELQPTLFSEELYKACIEELYPRNEAHQNAIKNRDFIYLLMDDIIFYQRPLKSQKSNISGCQLEQRVYYKANKDSGENEEVKQAVKAIPKSHPLFQEFRNWQWLQNLKIYNKVDTEKGELTDVTKQLLPSEDSWVNLFNFLQCKKELEQKQFIKYFIDKKLINKTEKDHYRWNYVEDKKYPFTETRAQFISRLTKVEGIEEINTFLDKKTQIGTKDNSPFVSRIEQLWHIIYSVSDIKEYESALEKFAIKHHLNEESFVANFIKFPPFKSDYGSYSKKALNKLLPLMRRGNYWTENDISEKVKLRVSEIMERVNALNLKEDYSSKELAETLVNVSDDDVKKQLIKSFVSFKDRNPLMGLNTFQATYLVYGRHSEVGDIQNWKTPDDIDTYLKNFKQHSLRNPIVEQVVTETLRVVRDIWKHHGKSQTNFFNEIHVELGREMKNPADKRKRISERNTENENTNNRIREILKDLMNDASIQGDVRDYSPSQQGILKIYEEGVYQNPKVDYSKVSEDEITKIRRSNNPTQKEIQRYRLWLEQGYISPYTCKPIPLSKLFTHHYQIEHIIPQSRYFDNSSSNKIICESEVNEDKDNKTAFEYLKDKGENVINGHKLLSLAAYEAHVNKYFKNNRQKLKNLLSEDIPEGFINRQMNDSRYISKLVKGLLSNIVREEGEQEVTSKNLIPVTGSVTSKLKNDWGLNDKWNELILPRFKRLNQLTQTNDFTTANTNGNTIPTVPDELLKGFSKKRIDHRHHALDALVVACCTRNHSNYLSALNTENKNYGLRDKLLIKNDNDHYTKSFQMPWHGFTTEAKNQLEETVISFKQNLRVINKANNKFWSYKDENGKLNLDKNGKPIKKLRKQTKGDNWAVRQPLHEETISGIVNLPWVKAEKEKFTYATRKSLDKSFDLKKIEKITDTGIQKILRNYLMQEKFKELDKKDKEVYNSELAFSQEGLEDLNSNIEQFNDQKPHKPIYKVRLFEKGSGRFALGFKGINAKKYAQGSPNLYFNIYRNEDGQYYETVPLNKVIIHQKNAANMPKKNRTPVPISNTAINRSKEVLVDYKMTLSPLDLVYIPTEEELNNINSLDFNNLSKSQRKRLYNVNDFSGYTIYFSPNTLAKSICPKEVDMKFDEKKQKPTGSFDSKTASLDGMSIKERCIKLIIDRLGNISKA